MKSPDGDYDMLMKRARKKVEAMNKLDGGMAAQPVDLALRTVMTEINSAFYDLNWEIIAEAQVMLSEIEFRYRPADQKKAGLYLKEKP